MAVLRSVAKTDTFEKQRQTINLLAQDLYSYVAGGQGISIFAGDFGDGTVDSPSIRFASDVKLGLFKEGVGKLGIASSSNQLVSFTSSGSYFVRDFFGEKRSIGSVSITTPGSGYEEGVYNNITLLGGSGLSSTANITVNQFGEVSDVTIVESGYAYSLGDILTVNDFQISSSDGTSGEAKILELQTSGFNYSDGTTYTTFYTDAAGAGSGLTVSVTTDLVGKVLLLGNLIPGEGYVSGPASFTTTGSGINLDVEITASQDGLVEAVSISSAGSGYLSSAIDVSTTTNSVNGSGLLVNYQANPGGIVQSLSITNSGSGYQNGESLTLSGTTSGTNLSLTAFASDTNQLGTFTLTNSGSGYVSGSGYELLPVTDESGLGGTVSVTTSGGVITSVTIDTPGSSFEVDGEYYIDGTGGLGIPGDPGFNAIITVNTIIPGGEITSITINNGGIDYQPGETFTVFGLNSGASNATIEILTTSGGDIYDVSIGSSKGSGYLIGDTITVSGGNNNATLTVNNISGGNITSVTIIEPNNSEGFQVNDLLQFSGGRTTGEVSVLSVTAGEITGLSVVDPGQDYRIGELLTVNGGSGSGTFTITETFDGSGFTLTVDTLDITNSISASIDEGTLTSLKSVSLELDSTTGSITNLTSDTILSNVSVTTPELISTAGLTISTISDVDVSTSNFNVGSTFSVESSTGNTRIDGTVFAGSLQVDSNINLDSNVISTLLDNDIILQPFNNKLTKVSTTSALVIPVGTTDQRPLANAETGSIRFNTDIQQYEGYNSDTNLWSSLGGVRDSDGNTYIIPESFSGANDNILYFFNNSANSLQLSESTLSFYSVDTITSIDGTLDVLNTDVSFNGNLTLSTNKISTQTTSLTLEPSSGSNVIIDSVTSLAIPVGTTAERGNSIAGGVRYNTTNSQFEGYNGTQWTSLGGVRDVDGNTFITPEEVPGSNDNTLYFVTDSLHALSLSASSLKFTDVNTITSANIFGIPKWQENVSYIQSDTVYYVDNVYTAAGVISSTQPPTHTTGTVDNWTFVRKTYGDIIFNEILQVKVFGTLNISDKLSVTNSTISTSADDLVLTPGASKKVVVSSTTSLTIPVGTSTNRGSASTGSIRYNTDNQQFEGYSGTAWTSLGGVRDVDGNTYIIPELTTGANDNTLWFYNDNINTIKVTPGELVFENIDTVSSTSESLTINSDLIEINSGSLKIDNSTTDTKLYSTQNNLDLGVSNSILTRYSGSGDIQVNTGFATETQSFKTVLTKDLSTFGLQYTIHEQSRITITKGVNNFASFNLFNTDTYDACKLTILAISDLTGDKHMVDYNLIFKGSDLYNIEYEGLQSSIVLYDAIFDISPEGDARVTVTIDSNVADGDSIQFTFINTKINN